MSLKKIMTSKQYLSYCTGTLRIISTVLIFRNDGGDSKQKMKRKERFPVMADGGQRKEDRGWRTEDGGQKMECRGRRTEDRGRRTDNGGRTSYFAQS